MTAKLANIFHSRKHFTFFIMMTNRNNNNPNEQYLSPDKCPLFNNKTVPTTLIIEKMCELTHCNIEKVLFSLVCIIEKLTLSFSTEARSCR